MLYIRATQSLFQIETNKTIHRRDSHICSRATRYVSVQGVREYLGFRISRANIVKFVTLLSAFIRAPGLIYIDRFVFIYVCD